MAVYPTSYKVWAYLDGGWVDLTSDCIKDDIFAMWGMMGNNPFDRLATTGRMNFQLNNVTGKYSPDRAGVLAGWKQGVPVRLILTYAGEDYVRFRGMVSKIDIKTGLRAKRVFVTALDWMDYAAQYPLVSQGYVSEASGDDALNIIVPAMPIPPQNTDFDVGASTFPVLFDTLSTKTRAYTEFSKIAFSEFGYIYLKKDKASGETLVFESANYRNGLRELTELAPGETFTADNSMMDADVTYGDQIINRIDLRAYPKRLDTTEQVLFSLGSPMRIGSGETIEFVGQYTDPYGGGTQVNGVPYLMIDPNTPNELGPKMIVEYTDPSFIGTRTVGLRPVSNDTYAQNNQATTNFGTTGTCVIGERNDEVTYIRRAWFKWAGLSDGTIPATATIVSASIWLYCFTDYADNARTLRVYRPKLAWVENELTWTIWKTGSAWNSLGGFNVLDCEQTDIGSRDFAAVDLGWKEFILTPAKIQEYLPGGAWTDNGFMIKADTELNDAHRFYTSDFPPTTEDFLMWTTEKIGGLNKSTYLTVVANYDLSTSSVHYTLTNTYTGTCWIRKLQARGIGLYAQNPAEVEISNEASYNEHGYQIKVLDQLYQRDVSHGVIEAQKIIDSYKKPKTTLNRVTFNANRNDQLMRAFLILDVGDLISIKEVDSGIDGWYYIQAVEFTIGIGGVIMFSWRVIAACSLLSGCLAPIIVDTSAGGGVNFGHLPEISNLPERTFSAQIYLSSSPTDIHVVVSTLSDSAGLIFFVRDDNSLRWFQQQIGDGGSGSWKTDPDVVAEGTWITVTGSRNDTDDPILYIDGVDQAPLTEIIHDAGPVMDETGNNFVIGNAKSSLADYTYPLCGYIKNVRVYNVILTPAEVADLAAGANITRGLVFLAPNVRTKELDYFDNTLLDEDNDKVIDDMYGAIGSIHAPVTSQLIPYP